MTEEKPDIEPGPIPQELEWAERFFAAEDNPEWGSLVLAEMLIEWRQQIEREAREAVYNSVVGPDALKLAERVADVFGADEPGDVATVAFWLDCFQREAREEGIREGRRQQEADARQLYASMTGQPCDPRHVEDESPEENAIGTALMMAFEEGEKREQERWLAKGLEEAEDGKGEAFFNDVD